MDETLEPGSAASVSLVGRLGCPILPGPPDSPDSSASAMGDGGGDPSWFSSKTGWSRSKFGKKSSRLLMRASVGGRLAHTSFSIKDFLLPSLASSDSHWSDPGVAGVLRE